MITFFVFPTVKRGVVNQRKKVKYLVKIPII